MRGLPHRTSPHGRRRTAAAGAVVLWAAVCALSAQSPPPEDVTEVLQRVGARVRQYFARAQSLVCLETVAVQELGTGLSPKGLTRTVESELRLSWEPPAPESVFEARTLRQVLKVNGGKPRRRDPNNCTAPEQFEKEEPALSMLLPDQQRQYRFVLAGLGRVDRRAALMLDYREIAKVSVDVALVEDNEDCLNFDMKGGLRGRVWIDPDTFDVLRLDQGLIGLVDVPLPRQLLQRTGGQIYMTMERWDTTTRFASLSFQDPDETLTLPVSISSLRITRGSGSPRQRTMTEFSKYRRFLTGGRILPPGIY